MRSCAAQVGSGPRSARSPAVRSTNRPIGSNSSGSGTNAAASQGRGTASTASRPHQALIVAINIAAAYGRPSPRSANAP